ncbi:MAG: plasmid mobilization relaxosome protein MobC [Cyclobacteriaceae bacterium]|nr:plasmid mobilization relaxosome protein MobC [Cyclobacteriaceae bacterium]
MGRSKAPDSQELLTHHIQARVSSKTYSRLNQVLQNSDCQSIGELARKILSREKFTCYYRNTTLDTPIDELISINKELNAIGVNINQITRHFHISETSGQKMFHALKVEQQYKLVGEKVDRLIAVVFELSKKWLQGSLAEKTSEEHSATMNTR